MRLTPDGRHVSQRLTQPYLQQATGDGAQTVFPLDKAPTIPGGLLVFVSGLCLRPAWQGAANDYTLDKNLVTFTAAPALAAPVLFFTLSV
jgi:hypothetical protein